MAEKDATDATGAVKPAKGSKTAGKLLLAVVLLVGLAGGWFLRSSAGGAANAAAGPTTTAAPEPGLMVSIPALSLNLADGHYLKIGVAVQLVDGTEITSGGHDGDTPVDAWLAEHGPVIRDLLINELGGAHVAELGDAASREAVRQRLLSKANEHLDGQVYALYFTEFVMQ
ncbi:MAG TPA: flagellar basal body-associated FliL family protein [Acidimicrobiales bacterium]